MRTKAVALLVVVVSTLFSACNRPSDTGEVQRLREEVERLKSAQRSAPPVATPVAESPDYQNFLRVARRLMTAIESGTSFQEFHQRAVEVLASAKEASPSAPTSAKQKAIATFVMAITDAHDIWGCSGGNTQEQLRYSKDKRGGLQMRYGADYHSCGRWDLDLPTLVAAYKLDIHEPGYPPAYYGEGASVRVSIESALKKIFKVCAETFEILEARQ